MTRHSKCNIIPRIYSKIFQDYYLYCILPIKYISQRWSRLILLGPTHELWSAETIQGNNIRLTEHLSFS